MVEQPNGLNRDAFDHAPIAPLGIIAMPGCEALGARINTYLTDWRHGREERDEDLVSFPGYERESFLLEAECPRFSTGEGKGILKQSVRGYDLYIITDVTAYHKTYEMRGMTVPMSPDDHYADLKRIIAAVGGKARRINVIMPFLYESRQHRRTSRESMDCALMLHEIKSMGVQNIITFDAHDPRVQNSIPLTGFESVHPTYQMLKALFRHEKDLNISKDSMMIISPDEGAINRNIYYSTVLGLDLGTFFKRRDYTQVVGGRNPIIAHEYLGASVEGKDIIVADDIIASGESILDLARELKSLKANRIFAAGTFAFFTNGLDAFNKAYAEGAISRVLGTNLNYLSPEIKKAEWFIEVDMSKYISYIIATLNHDHSLNKLLNPLDRIKNLLERYHREQAEAGMRFI
ncbi:ribose-phosphate pyrophosphokinase [Eubacteriales bacterium OttesenSCG-928-A19]|nr:ribose-phosphate pyrophosphokinase [Eubacteriales bacterium OttesenSCG-928-A19]